MTRSEKDSIIEALRKNVEGKEALIDKLADKIVSLKEEIRNLKKLSQKGGD